MRLDGRDVTTGFDLDAGTPLTGLEVEVAAASSRVTATVLNTRGEPVADRDVVVFPQDEASWGAQVAGHSGTGSTDDRGQYQSPALVAGAYYVAATDPLEPGQAGDPEFLASVRARAQKMTLGEGETAQVQLSVSDR